jgi:hypothetical protein
MPELKYKEITEKIIGARIRLCPEKNYIIFKALTHG